MINLFRYIGLRHLFEKPLRTSLTVFGMALGIGLSVAIHLINTATLTSFSETISDLSGEADVSITAGELGFPESQLKLIEDTPGVRHAVPVIEEHAFLRSGQDSESIYVLGVDMLRESSVRRYQGADDKIMDDPQVFLNQPDSLIVSERFAKLHHLTLNSTVDLATARGIKRFTIRGLLKEEGVAKAFGGAIGLMDIDGARVIFGKENKMDRVDVVFKESADADAVIQNLKATLGAAFKVERPAERAESFTQLISSFQKMLQLIGVLSVVIGLLLVGNAVKIAISERRREIGILRTLGTSKARILFMFLLDSLVLSWLGALIGAGVGYLIALKMVNLVSKSLSNEMLMHFQTPTIHFTPQDLGHALLIGTVAALIAALRPARNAAAVPPVEAMAARPPSLEESVRLKVIHKMALFGAISLGLLAVSSYFGWNLKYEWVQFLHQIAGPPALILLTPILTYWLAMSFSQISRWLKLDIVQRLAQDNLRREPGRAANNILTLGLGLYLVVVVSTINSSFKTSISDWADRSLAADLMVSSFGHLGTLQTQPLHESIKTELQSIPELSQNLSGPISGLRFFHTEYLGKTIAIKAFDDPPVGEGASEAYRFDVIDDDRVEITRQIFEFKAHKIAISKNFSTKFHVKPGQAITLDTPTGPLKLQVIALVNDFASHEGVIYMSRHLFQNFWQDDLVSAFYLNLKPGVNAGVINRAIDSKFGPERGLMVKFNAELKEEIMNSIDQSFAYTHAIELAALVCGLLGMMNMMFISVLERTREIGLLRSVGMSKLQVFRTIFTESISQGVIAGLVATSVGLFLAYLWIRFSLSNVIGWSVDFHVPSGIVLLSITLGVMVAGLAGLIPAIRAAQLEIKESLEYE